MWQHCSESHCFRFYYGKKSLCAKINNRHKHTAANGGLMTIKRHVISGKFKLTNYILHMTCYLPKDIILVYLSLQAKK